MTMLYPIVLETEESGAVSAYVPGLPVYAAAETHAKAERAIRGVLTEYLNAHPASRPDARVRVARFSGRGEEEGRDRRRRGIGWRPSKRHQGTRVANEWPARWSTSRCERHPPPRQNVALNRDQADHARWTFARGRRGRASTSAANGRFRRRGAPSNRHAQYITPEPVAAGCGCPRLPLPRRSGVCRDLARGRLPAGGREALRELVHLARQLGHLAAAGDVKDRSSPIRSLGLRRRGRPGDTAPLGLWSFVCSNDRGHPIPCRDYGWASSVFSCSR